MKALIIVIVVCFTLFACKKGKKDQPAPAPLQAMLVSPGANEACTEVVIVSPAFNAVTLKWEASANTDSYEVVIKNLLTQALTTQTSVSTQAVINLASNTPFSWYVVSKSGASTKTTNSETRKFYNPGQAAAFYAPFPPERLIPAMRQTVVPVNGTVSLAWSAEDADGDLAGYDVYLGTSGTNILLLQTNITAKKLDGVVVTANTTYYWKVVAKDAKANTAESAVYIFKVN